MDGFRGGVVGGTHSEQVGKKPWRVTFKTGTWVERTKTFEDEGVAKKWRKKYSNKHNRTLNRWRKHPTLANTVEMTVAAKVSVLFDEDKHAAIAKYVWCIDKRKRIYSSRRVIASTRTSYARRNNVRSRPGGQVSLLTMIAPGVHRPRRIIAPIDGVYDNRLSNITTRTKIEEAARVKKRGAAADLPDLLSPRKVDEYADEDFMND